MKNKKSQAVMEFLTTYGWAILASIIVIAVIIIYFNSPNSNFNVNTEEPDCQIICEKNNGVYDDNSKICYFIKGDFAIKFMCKKINNETKLIEA